MSSAEYVPAPRPVGAGCPSVGAADERERVDDVAVALVEALIVVEAVAEKRYGGVVYVGVGRTKFGSVVSAVADSDESNSDTNAGVSVTAVVLLSA